MEWEETLKRFLYEQSGCKSGKTVSPPWEIYSARRTIRGLRTEIGSMKTEDKRVCSVCGTSLAGDSELCPVCVLQGALKSQSDSISAGNFSSELRFEHYRVLQYEDGTPIELGRGAMGVTYKAFDVLLQRSAALKIISARLIGDDSARQRFVREARAAASVRHSNVASVFNMGEASGNYFYAMQFVDGETLDALIRRSGCLETDLALEILGQVASGLAGIEKQHLVHRDIKPSNVMVSLQDGKLENVKIIDLGLAKGGAGENTLSTVGAFIGTPAYASPEQFAGIATDIRSDLYSLGVTLWEMLSGKLPFVGSAAELMYQHQHAEPPIEKLKNISAPVIALLQVLLAKDPNLRFQSPAQLLEALTRIKSAITSKSVLAAKVFISHSSKDKAIAEAICQHLESAGVPCWIAPRDIEPGADWTEGIMRGITSSRIFVLVFSSHANNSEHVRREMGRAFSLHLPVIPFRTEAIEPRDNLGYFLESVQWLDATKPPLERYLPVLTERVKALLSGELALPHETAQANEQKQIPNAAPRRKRWLSLIALIGATAVVAAGIWFFVANSRKANESNPIAASAAIPAKSIAVLPFENISPNKEDAYFADGVQDEILNNLAKIGQLKVICRTSVMQYRADAKRDLHEIANALGVANVLEGTVRRDGNHVRVSTELVDARNYNTIWADSYDRDLADIFAIQSEVAQTIANKLTAALSLEERRQIEAKPTENLEAYDRYLRASELLAEVRLLASGTGSRRPLLDAIDLLEQAVQLDPKFALGYCAMTEAQDRFYYYCERSPQRRALGDRAINAALRLHPDLPEARLEYGVHLFLTYQDYERARAQLAMARRGLPNNSRVIASQAFVDARQGDFEKSIHGVQEAINIDPLDATLAEELVFGSFCARRFRTAESAYDQAIALFPDNYRLKVRRAWIAIEARGDLTGWLAVAKSLPLSVLEDVEILSDRIYLAVATREWEEAQRLLAQLNADVDASIWTRRSPVPRIRYTILIARLQGETPEALLRFVEMREELSRKAVATALDAELLSDLALIDALLGRKRDAIAEAKQATEILSISKDAVDGPPLLVNLAMVYAWCNEQDLAFTQLELLAKTPRGIYYGNLKLDPLWDPLRNDPRFNKLLAELAPRD